MYSKKKGKKEKKRKVQCIRSLVHYGRYFGILARRLDFVGDDIHHKRCRGGRTYQLTLTAQNSFHGKRILPSMGSFFLSGVTRLSWMARQPPRTGVRSNRKFPVRGTLRFSQSIWTLGRGACLVGKLAIVDHQASSQMRWTKVRVPLWCWAGYIIVSDSRCCPDLRKELMRPDSIEVTTSQVRAFFVGPPCIPVIATHRWDIYPSNHG